VEELPHGRSHVVLISGEAGVGKSRLVAEIAATGGGLVLQGHCFQTDRATPYGPFLDLIRTQALSAPSPSVLPDLHLLTRELARQFPELEFLVQGELPLH
jgi:predicted ATPase